MTFLLRIFAPLLIGLAFSPAFASEVPFRQKTLQDSSFEPKYKCEELLPAFFNEEAAKPASPLAKFLAQIEERLKAKSEKLYLQKKLLQRSYGAVPNTQIPLTIGKNFTSQ